MVGQRSLSKDMSSRVIKTRQQGTVRSPRTEAGVSLLGERSARHTGHGMQCKATGVSRGCTGSGGGREGG